MKLYGYSGCGTCKKAIKWLHARGIEFQEIPIRERPPSEAELRFVAERLGGDLRKLFNTSGQAYRSQGIKDRLPNMTPDQVYALLASDGNLVKRPFVLTEDDGWVGFKEADWAARLG